MNLLMQGTMNILVAAGQKSKTEATRTRHKTVLCGNIIIQFCGSAITAKVDYNINFKQRNDKSLAILQRYYDV